MSLLQIYLFVVSYYEIIFQIILWHVKYLYTDVQNNYELPQQEDVWDQQDHPWTVEKHIPRERYVRMQLLINVFLILCKIIIYFANLLCVYALHLDYLHQRSQRFFS